MEKNTGKKKQVKKAVKKVTPKKTSRVVAAKNSSKVKKETKQKVVDKPKKVKEAVKVEKVVEKSEPKEEKWYVWLKNNIIENEEKYSREYKNRRLIVALFMVFCFFTVLFSAAIADYNYAYKNNKTPFFSIKTRDEYKQATVYYGIFYKAWECDNGLTGVNFSRFKTEIAYCELVPKYNADGYYVNPNGVKITESQMNIIKSYYFNDYVYFKTDKELEDAYNISKEISKIWWVKKDTDLLIDGNEEIGLAIFGKVENINGVDEWKIQYDNTEYYRCVKNLDGVNIFTNYNYLDNTCDTIWETLSLNEETCTLIKDSTEFVNNLVNLTELCK